MSMRRSHEVTGYLAPTGEERDPDHYARTPASSGLLQGRGPGNSRLVRQRARRPDGQFLPAGSRSLGLLTGITAA
jgi:hypothetical protein